MRHLPNLYYKDENIWKEFPMTKEPVLLWSGSIYRADWKDGIQTISVNIIVGVGEDIDNYNYVSIPMIRIPDGMPLYSPATALDGYNHRWSGMGTLYDKQQYAYQGGYGLYMGALAANDSDKYEELFPADREEALIQPIIVLQKGFRLMLFLCPHGMSLCTKKTLTKRY